MGFECCRRKRLFGFRGDPQQLLSNHRWLYMVHTLVPEGTASLGGCIKLLRDLLTLRRETVLLAPKMQVEPHR